MTALTEFAPAKINLALHVTGQRADGYHLLDSLVTFAGVGDRIHFPGPAGDGGLRLSGPERHGLSQGRDNLVLRAAALMGFDPAEVLELEKHLPVASGIGGGSADAAATLRLIAQVTGAPLPEAGAVLALGADVPVCLAGQSCRMQGIGEHLTPVSLPPVWALLVNPRVALSTPAVFQALARKDNAPMSAVPGRFRDLDSFVDFLAAQRNDLEPAAIGLAPVIDEVLDALWDIPEALMARMSGSGATCFALFERKIDAVRASYELQDIFPEAWVAAAPLGDAAAITPDY